MMALEDVDALVKAAVEAEHKRVIENCTEVIDIHAAAAVKERVAAVEAARVDERKLCLAVVNEEMSMAGLLGPRVGRPMYLVVNDDLDGAASPIDCVWSAHATLHESVAKANENLEDPDAHLMAVLEIQPGETPKQVWNGGNGGRNGKRWGRYSNTP